MRIFAHFSIALRTFPKIKKQLMFSLISIAIGVACLYLIMFTGKAVRQETARRFHSQGLDLFSIIKRDNAGPLGPAQIRPLDVRVLEYLKHDPGYIIDVAPEIRRTEELRFLDDKISVQVIGVLEGYQNVHGLSIKYGRFINKFDSSRAYCVIGNRLFERLKRSSEDSLVGEKIHLGLQLYEVVGVLQPSHSVSSEYSIDEAALVSFEALTQFLVDPEITKTTILANPNRPIPDVIKYIQKNLRLYIGDTSLYEITNQQVFLQVVSKRIKWISFFLGTIGSFAFVVAAWSLLRLMSMSLLSRRNEITFLHILGMEEKKVVTQFVLESVILSIAGAILGLAIGFGLSLIFTRVEGWIGTVSYQAIALALLMTLGLGVVTGWFPATRTIYSQSDGE